MLDAVPAWVGDPSGEACFEGREVETLQAAIRTLDRQTRQLSAHGVGTAS